MELFKVILNSSIFYLLKVLLAAAICTKGGKGMFYFYHKALSKLNYLLYK
jgi:hypothetical protein